MGEKSRYNAGRKFDGDGIFSRKNFFGVSNSAARSTVSEAPKSQS